MAEVWFWWQGFLLAGDQGCILGRRRVVPADDPRGAGPLNATLMDWRLVRLPTGFPHSARTGGGGGKSD